MLDVRTYKRFNVSKASMLILPDQRELSGLVRDLSVSGARFILHNPHVVSDHEVFVLIIDESLLYPSRVCWQVKDQIGVEFIEQPQRVGSLAEEVELALQEAHLTGLRTY